MSLPADYPRPPYPAALPPARGRKPLLLIVLLVAVLIGLVCGGLLIGRLFFGGDAPRGPVAGQLRGTFPTQPQIGWQLHASDLLADAGFGHPQEVGMESTDPRFLDLGRVLVAKIQAHNSDRPAELVGIDEATGKVLWRNDAAGFSPVCATTPINDLLACLGAVGTVGTRELKVSFIRIGDGTIGHQLPAPEGATALLVHGSAIYTIGGNYERRTLARGNVTDLTAGWQQAYSLDSNCDGEGDWYYDANDDVVYAGNDTEVVVADARSGQRHGQRITRPNLFAGKGFTAQVCDGGDYTKTTVGVFDASGRQLRTQFAADGYVADPWLVADPDGVPLIIGDTAYDFSSGKQLWKAAGDQVSLWRIVGDVVVGREQGSLAGYDRNSGALLWNSPIRSGYGGRIEASDGQRVLVDDDGLVSINLATGQREWTLPSPGRIAPAGIGFASGDDKTITYYPPTGGASVAPGGVAVPTAVDGGGPITKCGKVPEMRPVEYRAENGSLVVKMQFKASCPGGDVVDSSGLRVTIRDETSTIASEVFDFSLNPVRLTGQDPTTVELTFGPGNVWRHPNTLGRNVGGHGSPSSATVAQATGNEVVDCEELGGGVTGAPVRPGGGQPVAPVSDPTIAACGSDADALNALRAQVDGDRSTVSTELADHWVAQLSAKRPGLQATDVDGRMVTWTPCEILRQHLRLRLLYPEVRLVWSDEWRTFDLNGWWVTFAGQTFADADAANRWCDERSIAVDQCFAKVISNSRGTEGSTKYRR